MKKWFLVLLTILLPVFAVSANAASVNPAELFRFVTPSKPASAPPADEKVAGPEFPANPISPYREDFYTWAVGNGGSAGQELPTPPSAVPLPAGVWLFGSAVLALVGVSRRKRH